MLLLLSYIYCLHKIYKTQYTIVYIMYLYLYFYDFIKPYIRREKRKQGGSSPSNEVVSLNTRAAFVLAEENPKAKTQLKEK